MALLIALAHSLLLGLPLFLLCLRLKNLEWWVAAIAGVVIGQLVPLILLIKGYPSLRFPVYFGSWGIFGAVAYWWIAIPGNPRFSFVRSQCPKAAIFPLALGLIGVCFSYRLN
ncbi:hypothetical protein BBFGKLBO_01205 [Synechococcus sp. CBW1107]|nr:hypothetical protein BBFGKLBO_01205 [Synechococcus sp. CBW1107]